MMKSGALAKLPRKILDRFEEFKNTTVVSFDDIYELEEKVDKLVIPPPRKLSIYKAKGSTSNHPISKNEVEAIGGPYLEFARSWVAESLGTSSRARVEAADLAIALPIVKLCSRKRNPDGTMPTMRIKRIWDTLFENGEVDRAFDYHRWRVIRDLVETQGGLEMIDRRFYTGFVNEAGRLIKGKAARWKMADWLIEKLDEIVESGYQQDLQEQDSLPCHPRERALLEQEEQCDQDQVTGSSPSEGRERALLEQTREDEIEDLFDKDWIIEFQQAEGPIIGLIWAGSILNIRREAG
jgi:hypothetical protein